MPAIELQNAGRRQLLEMFEWEKCRLVLKTAIPLFVNFECIALIGLVDIYLAGLIGPAAQASVGLGDQLLYLTTTVASGLSVATCAITARLFGAGRYARIRSSVCVSLTLGTVCGITAMLIGLIFAHRLLSMFSNDPEVIRLGSRYIQLCAPGSLPFVVSIIVSSIFRALGKSNYSTYLWLSTSALTIALSYILFFVRDLPLIGSNYLAGLLDALCVAWDIGAYVGLLIGLIVLQRQMKSLPGKVVKLTHFRRLGRLLILIGTAVIVAESSTFIADFLIYKMISSLPQATQLQAAWTIFMKVEETAAIMPLSAVSLALASLVGQWLGMRQQRQALNCMCNIGIAATISSALIGVLLIAAPQLLSFVSSCDATVAKGTEALLPLMPIFFPLLAIRLIAFSYLEGSGQTSFPLKLSLVGNLLKLAAVAVSCGVMEAGLSGIALGLVISRVYMAFSAIKHMLCRVRVQSCQSMSVSSSSSCDIFFCKDA